MDITTAGEAGNEVLLRTSLESYGIDIKKWLLKLKKDASSIENNQIPLTVPLSQMHIQPAHLLTPDEKMLVSVRSSLPRDSCFFQLFFPQQHFHLSRQNESSQANYSRRLDPLKAWSTRYAE